MTEEEWTELLDDLCCPYCGSVRVLCRQIDSADEYEPGLEEVEEERKWVLACDCSAEGCVSWALAAQMMRGRFWVGQQNRTELVKWG